MEILLLLLGELAAVFIAPIVIALFEGIAVLVALVVEWVGWRRTRRAVRKGEPRPPARAPRWVRVCLRISLVVGLLAVAAVAVVNAFFFEDVARVAVARIAARTGIAIDAKAIDGSLWTMRASLTDVRASRTGHDTSDFDLTAARVDLDVRVLPLVILQVQLESLVADRVTGTYTRTGVADRTRVRKPFVVDRLEATVVDVHVADRTRARPVDARVEIDRLVAAPFRSDKALFDLLFRADVTARVEGKPLTITNDDDEGRRIRWHVDGLPIALAVPYLPGPLGWFDGGTVTIGVDGNADGTAIDLATSVVFRDVSLAVPKDIGLAKRLVAKPVIAYIEHRAKHLPLSFSMRVDRSGVEASASPEAAGLLAAFREGLLRALAEDSKIAKAVIDRLRPKR